MSQVVQRCMKEARRKAEQMVLYLAEMKRCFEDILTFFGDDPKDDNARREFFAKLAGFVQEYKVCLSCFCGGEGVSFGMSVCADFWGCRNLTKRICCWKKPGGVMKRTCGGSKLALMRSLLTAQHRTGPALLIVMRARLRPPQRERWML